jgi:hypothetical protein
MPVKINIARDLRKCLPHLLKARDENLNEADTSRRIIKVFEDVLGYNGMTDISCEIEVRSKYADVSVKIDGVTQLFIEVKAATVDLKDRHVMQGEMYAAKSNVQRVLLTNGVAWNLYHLSIDEGLQYERVFAVVLSEETLANDAQLIGLLHRASIKAGEHEAYWKHCSAVSPASIGRALFTEDVMLFIRREIRKKNGLLIELDDVAKAIHSLFTQEVKEQIGPPKIHYHRATRQAKTQPEIAAMPVPPCDAPPQIEAT